ncbi:MAG: hotdog fold thioesterase [Acidimicrobiales bacterium]
MSDGRETPDADTRGDSGPHARSVVDAAHSMLAADAAAMSLGITIDEVSVGHAVLTMTVTAGMVNGLEVCHGGVIFTLADTAMAVASNACGRRTSHRPPPSSSWRRPASATYSPPPATSGSSRAAVRSTTPRS